MVQKIPTWYEIFRLSVRFIPTSSQRFLRSLLRKVSLFPPSSRSGSGTSASSGVLRYVCTLHDWYDIFRQYIRYIPTLRTIYSDTKYDIFRLYVRYIPTLVRYIPTMRTIYSDTVYDAFRHCVLHMPTLHTNQISAEQGCT